jgi:multidrug efflux system membrane fusion protein
MRRIAVIGSVAVALGGTLALSVTGTAKTDAEAPPVLPVRVMTVGASRLGSPTEYAGEVQARVETPMAFRVPGRIAARHVEVGSRVARGDLLATLDATDYQLSAQNLGAQVASAQADLEFQKAELDRGAELLKKGFISGADFERRRNVFKGVEGKLQQVRSALAQARNQAQYTVLRALSDGIVTRLDAEAGQVVAAGQTVMRIARPDEKEVVIHIPENRLEEVREAGGLGIVLWAKPGRAYRGRLREISPGVDPPTRTYVGKVAVLDADGDVQIGMTATVSVEGTGEDARLLPLGALLARDGETFVWKLDPTRGTVDLAAVALGDYHADRVAVRTGLADGDLIVTAGVHKLFPGQQVRILEENP